MYSKQLIDYTLDIVNLHTLQSMPYLALSALFLIFTLFCIYDRRARKENAMYHSIFIRRIVLL